MSPLRPGTLAPLILALLLPRSALAGLRAAVYTFHCFPVILTEEKVVIYEIEGDRASVRTYGNVMASMDGGFMHSARFADRAPTIAEAEDSLRYDERDLIDLARGTFFKLDPHDHWYFTIPIRPALPDTAHTPEPPGQPRLEPLGTRRLDGRAARGYRVSAPADTSGFGKVFDFFQGRFALEDRIELWFADRDPLLDRFNDWLRRCPALDSEIDTTIGEVVEFAQASPARAGDDGMFRLVPSENGRPIQLTMAVAYVGAGADSAVRQLTHEFGADDPMAGRALIFDRDAMRTGTWRIFLLEDVTLPEEMFRLPPDYKPFESIK